VSTGPRQRFPPPDPPPEDERTIDLLHRLQDGDAHALDRLLRKNLAPLQRWASGRLPRGARDLRDTEDLVQETILHALPRLADFEYRGEGAVQAYLRSALLNRIRNEFKRAGRRPLLETADSRLGGEGPTPLDAAIGRDAVEDYENALSSLDELDRQLVILRLELHYEYQAIADATGKPSADAARMATGRAILRLASRMRHSEG